VVGSVLGTPQRASLKFLADDLLDELANRLGPGSYEVHIVGGGQLKSELANRLDRPEVRIRGYVDHIAEEFLSSTVLLVPTPIDLGARTRIVEGFSFGCCVVTHSCDQRGMPEIEHEKNALVGSTPSEIADLVARCLSDDSLRKRLGEGARRTFEDKLAAGIVCDRMLAELERLAGQARAGGDSEQIICQPM
jgi:glycosyltransferase involved in cell wall biosynthesis